MLLYSVIKGYHLLGLMFYHHFGGVHIRTVYVLPMVGMISCVYIKKII